MPHSIEPYIFLLVVVVYVISWLVKAVGAVGRTLAGGSKAAPAEIARRQAMEAARRAQMPRPPAPQAARPAFGNQPAASRPRPAQPPVRRPDAGGPAVFREASDTEFRDLTRELFAEEPPALNTPLTSESAPRPAPALAPDSLLQSGEDLIRA